MLRASVCFAAPPSFPPTEELGKPLKDARVRDKRKPYSVVFKLCSEEPSWGSLEELRGQASGDQEKGPARAIAKGGSFSPPSPASRRLIRPLPISTRKLCLCVFHL